LIVAVHSECGQVGYGEGCPRSYVTGETVETGRQFIRKIRDAISEDVSDVESLRSWIDAHKMAIDENPSAFCAVEIAILDLLGKVNGCPVEAIVGTSPLEAVFGYSAVLGDAPYPAFWWQFRRYWKRGFRDFKIKVSGDLIRDKRKLSLLGRKAEQNLRVRVDANNLWTSADDCIRHVGSLCCDIFAIEEPLQPHDLDGFRQVGAGCSAKVILDESVTRIEHLDGLDDPGRWIVNIRVSKMGGIIRSLDVAQRAVRSGIGVIVGAQVGETSILTRSALTIMNAAKPNLVASEGAFGTYLLKEDLTVPCLMFGSDGMLDAGSSSIRDGAGLGLRIKGRSLI
jgi:L-alanine-DL-glutamate epimerase-like enolase superfamily enzyme